MGKKLTVNKNDIATVSSMNCAAIIAPAGHGKTEMIVDLVNAIDGKHLLLTHTNAGVDALQRRLRKKSVSKDKYSVNTIAGFCMKWCDAYPNISRINSNITISDREFYPMYYTGACELFKQEWACNVLKATYSTVIVDEYQDCVINQHDIFREISNFLRVYVLGDPLQAIFGWAGMLVQWDNLSFPILEFKTTPWRWKNTNMELGNYLSEIRIKLLGALNGNKITINTKNVGSSISVVPCSKGKSLQFFKSLQDYKSVLFINKWPKDQLDVCLRSNGLFQNDEPQALKELYDFARHVDTDEGPNLARVIYNFIKLCLIHISKELESYDKRLSKGSEDFHLIRKHREFGQRLSNVIRYKRTQDVLQALCYFKDCPEFRIYRKELYFESIRALNYSITHNISVEEAAQQIRLSPTKIKKYSDFHFLSSRTVLSKGLEYECVVINLSNYQNTPYNVTDFYVALTRATKKIYLITDKETIDLSTIRT